MAGERGDVGCMCPMHDGFACTTHDTAMQYVKFRCYCVDNECEEDDTTGSPRPRRSGGAGGPGRGDPNSAAAKRTARWREKNQVGARYFDKKLRQRASLLSAMVSKLQDKNSALERARASDAGAAAQLMRDICEMEELIFARVTWYNGSKVYLLHKVISGVKTLTLRWGGVRVHAGQVMLATGPVGYRSGTTTKRRIIRVTEVSREYSLLDISRDPILRGRVLLGEGLQDTDQHWQFFVGMMQALRPRCQIHGMQDFFIVGFELVQG
jgi:hypothetical protein